MECVKGSRVNQDVGSQIKFISNLKKLLPADRGLTTDQVKRHIYDKHLHRIIRNIGSYISEFYILLVYIHI